MMILSADEAKQVRGPSGPMASIEPVALTDGRFILGDEVLDDPAHAKFRDMLGKMPKINMDDVAKLKAVVKMPGAK